MMSGSSGVMPMHEGILVGHVQQPSPEGYIPRVHGARQNGMGMEFWKPYQKGWLGNPYSEEIWGRHVCILLFAGAFDYRLQTDRDFKEAVEDLEGSLVTCWCRQTVDDEPLCHLDVVDHHLKGNLQAWLLNVLVPEIRGDEDAQQ